MNEQELHYYMAALDEVWRLRRLMAFGADQIARIAAAGPKTRQRMSGNARHWLIEAAKGFSASVEEDLAAPQMQTALLEAGFKDGEYSLTRGMWEDEVNLKTPEWKQTQIKTRESAEQEAQVKVDHLHERIKLANDLLDLQEHMTKLHKRACDGNADLLDASEAFVMWLAQGIKDVEAEVVGYTFTREGASLQVRKTAVIEVTTL